MNTREKDSNVIHNLFAEFHYADDLGLIKVKLAEYVTTARKEEREAAFKDAISAVPQVGVIFPEGYEEWEGAPDFRERVISALEAAATTEQPDPQMEAHNQHHE